MVGGGLWGLEMLTLSLLLCAILGVAVPVAQAQVGKLLASAGQALVHVIQPTKPQVSNGDNVRTSH